MEEKYELDVYCQNCDFRGKVSIPKGTPFKEYPCPKCGIIDLEKDYNVNLSSGRESPY